MITALLVVALCAGHACASQASQPGSDVTGRVDMSISSRAPHRPAVAVWLKSVDDANGIGPPDPGRFTLLQKNRTFSPHLLVVPVGSVVSFPNGDPFFHNVFSLFNGKRFDLGLYEAGSTRDVVFSREGVSYIFCNIHPEMSAVVLSLLTPFFATAGSSEKFVIHTVPPGEYDLHVWIEGTPQPALDRLTRRVHVHAGGTNDLVVDATNIPHSIDGHLNKFGKPYDGDVKPAY